MKNSKMLTIMMIILAVITTAGIIVIVLLLNGNDEEADSPTIDEIVESSVEIEEITTNLADGESFIKIAFMIETDGKKGKEELEKRNFQVKNIILSELSELNPAQLQGKQGPVNLQETVKMKINDIMEEGTINKVYITSAIIQ